MRLFKTPIIRMALNKKVRSRYGVTGIPKKSDDSKASMRIESMIGTSLGIARPDYVRAPDVADGPLHVSSNSIIESYPMHGSLNLQHRFLVPCADAKMNSRFYKTFP